VGLAIPAEAVSLTGAIFTTDSTCSGIDLNIYTSKSDVYLDGGPQSNGPSLPAGSYYVQVTEPNGTLLGSSVGAGNPDTVGGSERWNDLLHSAFKCVAKKQ
jgi:hypothetical protein